MLMGIMLGGCGSVSSAPVEASGAPVPVEQIEVVPEVQTAQEEEIKADIDLTELSETMMWATLTNILSDPEAYVGQTIKMSGYFACIADDPNSVYCACLVKDAPGCCTQGIELDFPDEWVYPDDYPRADEDITVFGIFDIYEENGLYYWTLRNAKIL